MAEQEAWLIVKHDLYYRPDRCGYTGIRDHAGRYSQADAEAEAGHEGITAIRLADAPEFSKSCHHDLALKHVIEHRAVLLKMLVAAQSALKSYQFGNSSPELAEEICTAIDPVIERVRGVKRPCGECHLQSGEVCDICGAAS